MDVSSINSMQPWAAAAHVAPVEIPPAQREVIQAVKALNAAEMFGQENELLFQMDRQAHRVVVQVVNRETHEVYRRCRRSTCCGWPKIYRSRERRRVRRQAGQRKKPSGGMRRTGVRRTNVEQRT